MSKPPEPKFRNYPKSQYTAAQAEWCKMYERETLFEPVMGDYEAGHQTFKQAQEWNITWFKDWALETHARLERSK